MLKKVVVFFPYPGSNPTIGQKIFQTKGKMLHVMNTDQGYLVIEDETEPNVSRIQTIAVFKEWLYWEDKTEES